MEKKAKWTNIFKLIKIPELKSKRIFRKYTFLFICKIFIMKNRHKKVLQPGKTF